MKSFYYNVGYKLPISHELRMQTLAEVLKGNDPWFWVVHPGVNIESFFQEDEKKYKDIPECLKRGGAILFISGSARCELTEEDALIYEKRNNRRIHFLRTSCPDDPSSNAAKRIMNFLSNIENLPAGGEIPWHLLETEAIPKNLLALYFLVKAVDYLPEQKEKFAQIWKNMDKKWQENLIKQAMLEFEEKSPEENFFKETILLDSGEINPDFLKTANIPDITNSIRDCLSKY